METKWGKVTLGSVEGSTPLTKAAVRQKVWEFMEQNDIANFPRPVYHRIPNFKGSPIAAQMVSSLPEFISARTVNVSPDKPQEEVRYHVLEHGKDLIVPTPGLAKGLFNRLCSEPDNRSKERLKQLASRQGIDELSKPIPMAARLKIDLFVVGSVAVDITGRRIGKGEGFTDLEYAMAAANQGAIGPDRVVVTTVHDVQVFEQELLPESLFSSHDLPVDIIVTPTRVIRVEPRLPKPEGIIWNLLTREKLEKIPILKEIQYKEKKAGKDVRLKDDPEPKPKIDTTKENGKYDQNKRANPNPNKKLKNVFKENATESENGSRDNHREYKKGFKEAHNENRNLSKESPPENKTGSNHFENKNGLKENRKDYKNRSKENHSEHKNGFKEHYSERKNGFKENSKDQNNELKDNPTEQNKNPKHNDAETEEGSQSNSKAQTHQGSKKPAKNSAAKKIEDKLHNFDGKTVTFFVGRIPRFARVKDLKDAILEKDVKMISLTWKGQKGFAFVYLELDGDSTEESLTEKLKGLKIGDVLLNIELDRKQGKKPEKAKKGFKGNGQKELSNPKLDQENQEQSHCDKNESEKELLQQNSNGSSDRVEIHAGEVKNPTNVTDSPTEGAKTTPEGANNPTDGAKSSTDGANNPSDGAKSSTDGTKNLPDGTKNLPDGAKSSTDGTKNLPDGEKSSTEGAKIKSEEAKTTLEGAKTTPEEAKTILKGAKTTSEEAKTTTKGANNPAEGANNVADGAINETVLDNNPTDGAKIAAVVSSNPDGAKNTKVGANNATNQSVHTKGDNSELTETHESKSQKESTTSQAEARTKDNELGDLSQNTQKANLETRQSSEAVEFK